MSKTVVITSESFYPIISGVAIMTERLAHHLAQEGYRVVVLTPSRNRGRYTEQRRGYTIERIPSWPMPWKKGLRLTVFPNITVKRLLDELKPDIVHIHDPGFMSLAVARYSRKRNIPVLVTHHFVFEMILAYVPGLKLIHETLKETMQMVIFQIYEYCDLLTVPTRTIYNVLRLDQLSIPSRIVSNGVDCARFGRKLSAKPALTALGIPEKLPLLTYVGRLDPEKNVGVLLQAMAKLQERGVDFHALIVGNGKARSELQEQARELGLDDRITWVARVENQSSTLIQLLQASRAFCIPSTIETESIVTMEAMAAGLPVVACNRNALTELVEDGVNGFLVEPDDVDGWTERLQVLATDKKKASEMGKISKERIQARDLPITLGQFSDIYRELLGSR